MFPGNYTTTTTNYKATDYASTSTGNLQVPLDVLKSRASGHYHTRKSTKFGRELALRNVKTAPDPKDRSVTSQAQQLQPWLQRFSDWGNWVGEQLADALIGDDEALQRPKDTAEPAAPGQKQKPAKTEVSADGRSGDYRSMDSFLKGIKGKFICTRQGKPCTALEHETVQGKVIIIGYNHLDAAAKTAIQRLIKKNLQPQDRVVAEATEKGMASFAAHPLCFGAPKEQCIPGEKEELGTRTREAIIHWTELCHKRLALIDHQLADQLAWKFASQNTEYNERIAQYGAEAERRLYDTPVENRAAVNQINKEILKAKRKAEATALEESVARDANHAEQIRESLTRKDITVYRPIGELHARSLAATFNDNPNVLVLMPREEWRGS
jgi:hypothetical protein